MIGDIAYTGLFYLAESAVCFWGSWRYWKNYQETGNSLYKLFSRGGLGIGISFLVFSLASIQLFQDADSLRVIWYAGMAINYWALAHMLYIAVSASGHKQRGLIISALYAIGVVISLACLALQPSLSYVARGIIVWNIIAPFNIISAALFALALAPITVMLLTNRGSPGPILKQSLMGISFLLAGAGAVTVVLAHDITTAWLAHLTSLVGFLCFVVFFLIYPRKEIDPNTSGSKL